MLAAYVTGHGFGHLVRTCEVLAEVRACAPSLPITVAVSYTHLTLPTILRV